MITITETDLIAILIVTYVIVIIVLAVFSIIREHRKNIVLRTSKKLKMLSEVNNKYNFNAGIKNSFCFTQSTKSKAQLEKFNVVRVLNGAILSNPNLIDAIIAISENRNMYADYLEETEKIRSGLTPEDIVCNLTISYDSYKKTENYLFEKEKVKPILDLSVMCYVTYTSPKGRNNYQKSATYKTEEVFLQAELLRKHIEYESSEERRKQLARSKMTDKLRYTVLKRDGFRCKICGRSAEDGVKLHVDHIIPVSKGGETTLDNLRALCEQCNLGKSDEIE